MCLFRLIINDMICYRIRTRIAIVIRKIFEEHKVVNKFYIFRKICVVCLYDEDLINCYLFVVALIVIAIIFAIFILIVVSISLCIVLFISRLLILIARIFVLIICERICRRYNCEFCERLRCLKLCRRLLH